MIVKLTSLDYLQPVICRSRDHDITIVDFLKQAKHLARQIFNSEVDVDIAIIQDISDENKKEQISFECHKDPDFTFVKVKKLI